MDTVKAEVGDYITWGAKRYIWRLDEKPTKDGQYVLSAPFSLIDGSAGYNGDQITLAIRTSDIEVFPVASYEYPEAAKLLGALDLQPGMVLECVLTSMPLAFTEGAKYRVVGDGAVSDNRGDGWYKTKFTRFKVVSTPVTPAPIEPPRVLALAGRAGSGKSTVAEHLISEHGYVRVKFAGPLKNMLRAVYKYNGVTGDEVERRLEGDLKEVPDAALGGRSPRHAMQALGGEWGREMMHSDLWVSMWEAQVQQVLVAGFNVIVDDLRYANEAAAVHKFGGTVLGLTGRDPVTALLGHSSEVMDLPMDVEVTNTGTVGELKKNVEKAIGVGA